MTLVWAACSSTITHACTVFSLQAENSTYVGRNLDWYWSHGIIIVNPRNVAKSSFISNQGSSISWVSKYGSVTFNQFGQDMPYGGMNEKGLVVLQLALMESEYPQSDERKEINMLQWIQYQLDNSVTVADVVASKEHLRVIDEPGKPKIHYFAVDAGGATAVLEYIDGKLKAYYGKDIPVPCLANSPYTRSIEFVEASKGSVLETSRDSLSRFAIVSGELENFEQLQEADPVSYAFNTLAKVSQDQQTVWQMVYDTLGGRIHYKTLQNETTKVVDFNTLEFDKIKYPLYRDIHSGSLHFAQLTEERHRDYLEAFLSTRSVARMMGDISMYIDAQVNFLKSYDYLN